MKSSQALAPVFGLVSVGYEGQTIDSFIAELVDAKVSIVADVRLNAISRKPGFSKRRLQESLAASGIDYRHLRELGNAKENRQPFWDGRVELARSVFRKSLESPQAAASLKELSRLAREQVVAVLCFESDAQRSHRKVIIDHVVRDTSVPATSLVR